jgi:hypothetical protein
MRNGRVAGNTPITFAATLTPEQQENGETAGDHRWQLDQGSRSEEEERRQEGESDAAHPPHHLRVGVKDSGGAESQKVRG